MPPGTFTGLLIAPGGISATRRATSGSSWLGCTQPSSPPCKRGLVLAELRRDHREGRAGAQLVDHRLGEALRVGGVGGIVHRNEDLADAIFGLADLLRQQPLLLRPPRHR